MACSLYFSGAYIMQLLGVPLRRDTRRNAAKIEYAMCYTIYIRNGF